MGILDVIKTEIERRIKSCDATSKTPNQLLWAELSALLPFLDTLEEPDKDLEEVAKQLYPINLGQETWVGDLNKLPREAFKAGAEWQKEQMMKEDKK